MPSKLPDCYIIPQCPTTIDRAGCHTLMDNGREAFLAERGLEEEDLISFANLMEELWADHADYMGYTEKERGGPYASARGFNT